LRGPWNEWVVKKGRSLPVFRFNKAFGIARDVKVFLALQGGIMRGALPDVERYKKRAEPLRNARQLIKEQRKALRSKDREILQLKNKDLRNARRRIYEQGKALRSKDREIFQLMNELRAMRSGTSETGALPDFLIIGAQKSGTTSLYDLLTRHPNVERAALKELNYFNRHFKKGIEWYRSQFPLPSRKEGQKLITGEATPDYLSYPDAPRRAAQMVPQARLIVLLRNPVDRAYSHYHHQIRKGRETMEFEEVIEAEQARLRGEMDKMLEDEHYNNSNRKRFFYLSRGVYVDHLLRWSEFFGEEQILVLKSEDFYEHTPETLKLIQDFLHLPDWQPEPSMLQMTPKRQNRYPKMNPATRRRLEEYFEPHNRRLYEYLGVDFGW
jgi:hypothetical protein